MKNNQNVRSRCNNNHHRYSTSQRNKTDRGEHVCPMLAVQQKLWLNVKANSPRFSFLHD